MEKSWYFLVEFLTSLTSFFVSFFISAMNFWLENLPKAMASSCFSHFSVSSGVTRDGLTSSSSWRPLRVTRKKLPERSISSDDTSFSMISARVAGVPRLYLSIKASRPPSVNGFGGVVSFSLTSKVPLICCPSLKCSASPDVCAFSFHPFCKTVVLEKLNLRSPKETVIFSFCSRYSGAKSITNRLTIIP